MTERHGHRALRAARCGALWPLACRRPRPPRSTTRSWLSLFLISAIPRVCMWPSCENGPNGLHPRTRLRRLARESRPQCSGPSHLGETGAVPSAGELHGARVTTRHNPAHPDANGRPPRSDYGCARGSTHQRGTHGPTGGHRLAKGGIAQRAAVELGFELALLAQRGRPSRLCVMGLGFCECHPAWLGPRTAQTPPRAAVARETRPRRAAATRVRGVHQPPAQPVASSPRRETPRATPPAAGRRVLRHRRARERPRPCERPVAPCPVGAPRTHPASTTHRARTLSVSSPARTNAGQLAPSDWSSKRQV